MASVSRVPVPQKDGAVSRRVQPARGRQPERGIEQRHPPRRDARPFFPRRPISGLCAGRRRSRVGPGGRNRGEEADGPLSPATSAALASAWCSPGAAPNATLRHTASSPTPPLPPTPSPASPTAPPAPSCGGTVPAPGPPSPWGRACAALVRAAGATWPARGPRRTCRPTLTNARTTATGIRAARRMWWRRCG
ncbi:hypothetical protein DFJ74DRAFT_517125 [Hyaloraphidium curvatum]|nr:hypothetical protein DFJ74DRAFT_517125 [Hyaloraphidium curvatum]